MKKRVLIVDDEIDLTQSIKSFLEGNDYEVQEVNDSHLAFQYAIDFKPSVILLDLVMPGLNGQDVIEKLLGHPETKNIPVIIISGTLSIRELAERRGILSKYLTFMKPPNMEEVLKSIEAQAL